MAKKRVERQTIVNDPDDIFGGMGHFVPMPTIQLVEVKSPTRVQRQKIIQRLIDKLDPPREVLTAQKAKPVKRTPKSKSKKGKKVEKVVLIQSPNGHPQPIPFADLSKIRELLTEGWQIIGDEPTVREAYKVLKVKPKELQSA
jgi:hypothetical protein